MWRSGFSRGLGEPGYPKRIATYAELIKRALRRPVFSLPKSYPAEKRRYKCEGGPWAGAYLWLADGTTAQLRVRVQARGVTYRGRYRCGMVASRNDPGTCTWIPA